MVKIISRRFQLVPVFSKRE